MFTALWTPEVFFLRSMNEQCCILVNWNVRGLNGKARRKVVKDLVQDSRGTIACLLETKLGAVTDQVVMEAVGTTFASNFAYLPAQDTRRSTDRS